MTGALCSECDRPSYGRGLCVHHYGRLRRHGSLYPDNPRLRDVIAELDVDEVAIQRAVDGLHPALTICERREAVRRLRLSGMPTPAIAERLDMHQRQVCRDVRRFGLCRDQLVVAS